MKRIHLVVLFVLLNLCYASEGSRNILKARPGQFPFLARLEMQLQWPNSGKKTYCAASLITWKNILTAASCFVHHADPKKILKLCVNRKLRVYVGKSLHSFTDSGSVGYLEDILPHGKYKRDINFDIAVGRLVDSFETEDGSIKPIALARYTANIKKVRVCPNAVIIGMGKASSDTLDTPLSVIYVRVRTYKNSDNPTVHLPLVQNFGIGRYRKENVGGPLICYHPGYKLVQYGVTRPGQAILVELMVDFINVITGEHMKKDPPKEGYWRTNKTDDDKIGKTDRGLASSGKAKFCLLVCAMVLLIVK